MTDAEIILLFQSSQTTTNNQITMLAIELSKAKKKINELEHKTTKWRRFKEWSKRSFLDTVGIFEQIGRT